MLGLELNIQIDEPFTGLVSEDWIKSIVEIALKVANVEGPIDLGLVIATDKKVQKLNATYRGIDRTTDVLAFAFSELDKEENKDFVLPPGGTLHLGEIIISYPRAERQAEEYSHSIEHEFVLLITHGVLHLLGYDHEELEAERQMKTLETKVIEAFGFI